MAWRMCTLRPFRLWMDAPLGTLLVPQQGGAVCSWARMLASPSSMSGLETAKPKGAEGPFLSVREARLLSKTQSSQATMRVWTEEVSTCIAVSWNLITRPSAPTVLSTMEEGFTWMPVVCQPSRVSYTATLQIEVSTCVVVCVCVCARTTRESQCTIH